jgi:peptidoglycan/LPS O-acetylase OafA/YrhL
VVAGHIRALFFRDYADVPHGLVPASFYVITGLGREAVMVFFVLSGFWVGGTVLAAVRKGRFQWTDYAIRRLSRLWVVVLPGLVLTFVCAAVTLHFFGHSDVAAGNPAYHGVAPAHLAERIGVGPAAGNSVFLQEILVPSYGGDGPLWSLAYEFWFYAMFPMLLLVVATRDWRGRLVYAALLGGVAWLVGWTILSYFPVWLLGAAVAVFRNRLLAWTDRLSARVLAPLRACAGIAVVGCMVASSVGLLGPVGDAAIAGATACLLALLLRDVRHGRVLGAVGGYAEASYSLYVVHLPLLALLTAAVLPRAADRHILSVSSAVLFLALLAGALVVGWMFASVTEFHTSQIRRRAAALLPRRLQSARA